MQKQLKKEELKGYPSLISNNSRTVQIIRQGDRVRVRIQTLVNSDTDIVMLEAESLLEGLGMELDPLRTQQPVTEGKFTKLSLAFKLQSGRKHDESRWKTLPLEKVRRTTPVDHGKSWAIKPEKTIGAAIMGAVMGKSLDKSDVTVTIDTLVEAKNNLRKSSKGFIDTFDIMGGGDKER